jgi:hypothetical protein
MGVTPLLLHLSFFAPKYTYLNNENIFYRYCSDF